ncbi:MAG: hypothetical protein VX723_02370, partial [Candidatus Thermoplasmatota archaeon]|nr:hypothetical protein [Candidatus Thermoplasmatota archaeon]
MSDDPPPPEFPPPPPPPPPPPGFEEDDEEAEEQPSPDLSTPPPPPLGYELPESESNESDSSPIPSLPPGLMEIEEREIFEEERSEGGIEDLQPSYSEPSESFQEGAQIPPETPNEMVGEEVPLADSLVALDDSLSDSSEPEIEWSDTVPKTSESIVEESSSDSMSTPIVTPTTHPYLRSSTEIDAIPGDKLHATLSEIEESTLNPDGSIHRQSIEGELILRNSSKKHRAWDIEVLLSSTDSTDIGGRSISVRELEASEETTIPYSASGPTMLVMREFIDTNPERDQEDSQSLVFSQEHQEIEIHIEVENSSPVSLLDVELTRKFPENFEIPEGQQYNVSESIVSWDIGRLAAGESRKLSLMPRVLTQGIETFSAGSTSAIYSSEDTVSRAQFDRVSASTLHMMRVDKVEDDRPGIWHCKSVFENRSSFVVTLSGVTVWLSGREQPILDVSDLRQDVPPEGSWSSMEKRVESDTPSFTHEFRSSILPRVSVSTNGSISLKEQELTVLEAELNKQYDMSRIKSFLPADLEATITVENTGSAPINVMRLIDDVPGIFSPPSESDVSIDIEGTDLTDEQYTIEVIEGIQLEEKMVSPDGKGYSLRITVGTSAPLGLQPGKKMVLSYPLHAPDPSNSNKLLAAPVRLDFGSEKFGPVGTRNVERPPQIEVVHRRRNISTGKEVFPAGNPGRYEVLLMFINNSDSALEDLSLHDVVPGTFSIEKSSVRSSIGGNQDTSMTKESAPEGTHVEWPIGRIEMGERIEVTYVIQGDPESEYKVSDAQDFHGATFGDEVDEEPNLPKWIEIEEETEPEPEP